MCIQDHNYTFIQNQVGLNIVDERRNNRGFEQTIEKDFETGKTFLTITWTMIKFEDMQIKYFIYRQLVWGTKFDPGDREQADARIPFILFFK